ncbi:hypothetical protein BD779DRAFT_1474813 [Infundibulicybe gibba]|nr:hypothetical protein BD779DRAFT_1474813 [Infundibulicybe gibba]
MAITDNPEGQGATQALVSTPEETSDVHDTFIFVALHRASCRGGSMAVCPLFRWARLIYSRVYARCLEGARHSLSRARRFDLGQPPPYYATRYVSHPSIPPTATSTCRCPTPRDNHEQPRRARGHPGAGPDPRRDLCAAPHTTSRREHGRMPSIPLGEVDSFPRS